MIVCGDMMSTRFPKARLVLTDPPYNIGFRYDIYDDKISPDEYCKLINISRSLGDVLAIIQYPEECARYIYPTLGAPDEIMAWCYNTNISKAFRLINIYGAKPDYARVRQPYKNPTDKRIKARILSGSIGGKLYDWFSDIQLVKNVSEEKTSHPCPIPIALAERIILLLTEPGDMVVDPFSGCGTVGIAALKNKRLFFGTELSEKYCDEGNIRIKKYITEAAAGKEG